jgi:hypothetical protein
VGPLTSSAVFLIELKFQADLLYRVLVVPPAFNKGCLADYSEVLLNGSLVVAEPPFKMLPNSIVSRIGLMSFSYFGVSLLSN